MLTRRIDIYRRSWGQTPWFLINRTQYATYISIGRLQINISRKGVL